MAGVSGSWESKLFWPALKGIGSRKSDILSSYAISSHAIVSSEKCRPRIPDLDLFWPLVRRVFPSNETTIECYFSGGT
jgi:hypothetical protein